MRFVKESKWSRTLLVLACVGIVTFLVTFSPHNEVFADDSELAAVYRNGALELNIPLESSPVNGGALSVEILDPGDKLVAKAVRSLSSSDKRSVRVSIPLEKTLAIEDVAWDRLKLNVGDSSKTVSISEILHVPVVPIFSQRAYAAGAPSSIRVITADSKSGN